MTQGTKIVAVVLFVLFVGTGIYYVTLSPAKPASPSAAKPAATPAAVERNPGSITMGMPAAPSAAAAPAPARVADPLSSASGGGVAASAPASPSAPAAATVSGPVGSPIAAPAPAGTPGRVALGPGGTPTAVMPPLTVSRPVGVPTSTGASAVRPTTPPSSLSEAPTLGNLPATSIASSAGNPTSSSNAAREHVVASGDTLSSIAARYLGSETKWEEIAKANPGVNPNALKVGAKLAIPAGSAASTSTRTASTANASTGSPASGNEYVVKAGDTLTGIARQTLGNADWESIYEANRSVIGPNPAALKVGMKLSIPKRS